MASMRGRWMLRHWLRVARAPAMINTQVTGIVALAQSNRVLLAQRQRQGLFAPNALKKIESLVIRFTKAPGDASKDPNRQKLARRIMAAGRDYANRLQARRDKIVATEVDSIDALLSSNQQNRIATAMNRFLARFN